MERSYEFTDIGVRRRGEGELGSCEAIFDKTTGHISLFRFKVSNSHRSGKVFRLVENHFLEKYPVTGILLTLERSDLGDEEKKDLESYLEDQGYDEKDNGVWERELG